MAVPVYPAYRVSLAFVVNGKQYIPWLLLGVLVLVLALLLAPGILEEVEYGVVLVSGDEVVALEEEEVLVADEDVTLGG